MIALLASAAWTVYASWRSTTKIAIGDGAIQARLARTEPERIQGLSGVKKLNQREGMLFVFDSEDYWSIWMKEMHFPIDVIWLDSAKKVVHITKNITPETYPTRFQPKNPARYVLEVPAGVAESSNISIDKQATFELP